MDPYPEPDSPPAADLRWSQEARLRAIDAAAFWEGRVNRADLIGRFGISVPQATNDLRRYLALAPANLRYDTRQKAYLATPAFAPLFGPPDAEAWLRAAEGGAPAPLPVETVPLPPRRLDPFLLRRILAARREGLALRVLYQPMDEPDPSWRWASPCAVASDGLRWHLRAYNHDRARFDDLLFPRILRIDGERPAGGVPADEDWHRIVPVSLHPAQRLSPSQRAVVAADYGMEGEGITVPVRAALLFLFLQRLGTDRPGALVELAEPEAVAAEVEQAGRRDAMPG